MINYIVVRGGDIQELDKRRITGGGAAKVIKGIERLLENKGLNVSYTTIQEKLMREERCEFIVPCPCLAPIYETFLMRGLYLSSYYSKTPFKLNRCSVV